MLVGTVMAVAYMFTTFATASDLEDLGDEIGMLDARMIKSQIRDIRSELRHNDVDSVTEDFLLEDLEELIDDLCIIIPDDRNCVLISEEE